MRHNGEEFVIGEGQLRNVDVNVNRDVGRVEWSDPIMLDPITYITIRLEVDTRGAR